MKLNIQKFAAGGQTYFSAVANPYAQQPSAEQTGASSKSSGAEDSELVPKAVLNELIKNGLPNDVDAFMKHVSEFEKTIDYQGVNKNALYALLSEANRVIKQGDFLKQAETSAIQNNAIDEIAISPKSELFVIDSDSNIKKVHVSRFDSKKHHALTVGELLEYRKYAPELTQNHEIATIAGHSIGLEKIQEYISKIINTVGTSESTSEAYTDLVGLFGQAAKRPTGAQLKAMQEMYGVAEELGLDAIFKYKDTQKSKNIEQALSYVMNILPQNMKNQLIANSVAQGYSYKEAIQNAGLTIKGAFDASNDIKQDYSITYDQTLNKAAKTTSSQNLASSEDTRHQTTVEMFFNQDLNRGDITISDARYKNQIALVAKGTTIPSLAIDGGAGIGSGPLLNQLEAGGKGMGKYLDMNKVWMGYDRVNPEILSQVLYKGDQVANVWLPTTDDGEIDWESVTNYAEAEKEIELHNITDPAEKNKVHAKYGSPVQYDSNGQIIKNGKVENFMMIHGFTVDNLNSENLLYRDVDEEREKLLTEQIDAINQQNKKGIKMNTPGWFSNYVEVPIFIKIQPNAATNAAYYARQGSLVPEMSLQDDMTQQMMQQQPQIQVYGNAAALYGQQ